MIKNLHLCWVSLNKENAKDEIFHNGYFDFILSGQPLFEYLGFKINSYVTPFGYFPSKEELNRALNEFLLLKKPALPDNRIELYICECCGDIGCGSITAKIVDKGEKIVWSHFANQSKPDQIGDSIEVEDIEFDRAQYFKAFSEIK